MLHEVPSPPPPPPQALLQRHHTVGTVIKWDDAMKYATGIASGMFYLHCRKPVAIMHRDLKPANCLIDGSNSIKVRRGAHARRAPLRMGSSVVGGGAWLRGLQRGGRSAEAAARGGRSAGAGGDAPEKQAGARRALGACAQGFLLFPPITFHPSRTAAVSGMDSDGFGPHARAARGPVGMERWERAGCPNAVRPASARRS